MAHFLCTRYSPPGLRPFGSYPPEKMGRLVGYAGLAIAILSDVTLALGLELSSKPEAYVLSSSA
mgnify:CR=1 FL=1